MRKIANEELGRKTVADFKEAGKTPFVIVLDNIRSLNNVGSVFRTADAFLVDAIYLCGITGQPPHKEIQKTALGATESVDWYYFESTLEALKYLKDRNFKIISIEQVENSIELQNYKIEQETKYAFVFGNEVNGVSQEVVSFSDEFIEIPQFGTKHSFNISVSAGIVLWDLFNKYSSL